MKDFFLRVAGCEFIQMNRRSASFECWVYHFELNNPLSASISYSNESMKREIWKLNLKTCKKNLWMQSDQYSQRALNNLCSCVTEPIGWRQYFRPPPSNSVLLWGKCNPYLPPEEYCSLLDTCPSFKLFKSFQKWPNMANFTTENNTYCFRIGPAFLDTIGNYTIF